MTAATESTSPPGRPLDPDELRDNLRQADPGVLVAVLAQLTGDAVGDRHATHPRSRTSPIRRSGPASPTPTPPTALVNEIVDALDRPRRADAVPADDRELLRAAAADRAGFGGRRRAGGPAARAGRLPAVAADTAAHRADPRHRRRSPSSVRVSPGISVALAAAAEGVSLRDLRPQRGGRRHLADHHLPGHRRRHPVGVLLVVA